MLGILFVLSDNRYCGCEHGCFFGLNAFTKNRATRECAVAPITRGQAIQAAAIAGARSVHYTAFKTSPAVATTIPASAAECAVRVFGLR